MTAHLSELTLRKFFAGEAIDETAIAHQASCEACRARLKGFEDEQKKFEQAIPFERFAAGVERATRTPRQLPAPAAERKQWARIGMAIAASLIAVVALPALLNRDRHGGNRVKGGASGIEMVVAGNGPQRSASADPATPEALAVGERVRVGYRAGQHRYLVAVSVDEAGTVSPIYDLPIHSEAQTDYLPDSLEFTGRGLERVVVVLSDEPVPVDELRKAVRARYDEARGNLSQLGTLDVPGEQFHRTFLKP